MNPEHLINYVIVLVVAAAVPSLFAWIGAKVARLENASFGKAFRAAVLATLSAWGGFAIMFLGSAFLGSLELSGNSPGYLARHRLFAMIILIAVFLIGVVLTPAIFRWIYKATWGKVFLIWLFFVISHVFVLLIVVVNQMSIYGP